MWKSMSVVALALGIVGLASLAVAQDEKPKNTISEVMKKAHAGKDSLFKKVSAGKGNKEEKEELLALYEDLGKNKPEKGEAESWKKKTDTMVTAAKAVVKEDKGSTKKLQQAVNCKACHDTHK